LLLKLILLKTEEKSWIYGLRAMEEAFQAGKSFEKIWVVQGSNREWVKKWKSEIKTYSQMFQEVPEAKLEKLAPNRNHQGVMGLLSLVSYVSVDEMVTRAYESGQMPLILILDGVTDVRNLGAIARTAECMGVHALVLPKQNTAPINSDAIKTAAGAFAHLPVARVDNLKKTIVDLQSSGIQVYACSEKSDSYLWKQDLQGPTAIVLGDESEGISPAIIKLCQAHLNIPQSGQVGSLNVSVAAGMILYEISKQRLN